jgi:hypothetical protein
MEIACRAACTSERCTRRRSHHCNSSAINLNWTRNQLSGCRSFSHVHLSIRQNPWTLRGVHKNVAQMQIAPDLLPRARSDVERQTCSPDISVTLVECRASRPTSRGSVSTQSSSDPRFSAHSPAFSYIAVHSRSTFLSHALHCLSHPSWRRVSLNHSPERDSKNRFRRFLC